MDGLRQYIFSVTVAAVVCGVVKSLSQTCGCKKAVHMLCGLFLAVTILTPIARIDPDVWIREFSHSYYDQGQSIAAMGEENTRDSMAQIIKSETEAYILDKAAGLQASLKVTVTLSEEDIPLPESAEMKGTISPYARQRLTQILEEDLGIAKENQRWIG